MPPPPQVLDHLILFVPASPTTHLPSVPPFLAKNFTLSPGGFHTDGVTSNILVLLADGCYIELISFVDPSLSAKHWWGPDAGFTGWKDWCLTNSATAEENHVTVNASHDEPVRGARTKPDGVEVKWGVTFPRGEMGGQGVRGRIPFFCHDVTERGVRVPVNAENTAHACGALGVWGLTVVVGERALLNETRRVYRDVLGDEGVENGGEVEFRVERVINVDGLREGAKIILRLPRTEDEVHKTKKSGFWYGDVVLAAKTRLDKPVGTRERLDSEDGEDVGGLWIEYV